MATEAFVPDADTGDLQREEVQALEAIFEDAFELRSIRKQDDEDGMDTFDFPIVYCIKLNDMDTADDDGSGNSGYDGTKNWPTRPLTVEVRYPKNYLSDEDGDDENTARGATATDPTFRLLHENSVLEFPSSVSEGLLAVLAETAESERGMPCVLSCLYAARDYLDRDREWDDRSNQPARNEGNDLDGAFAQNCSIDAIFHDNQTTHTNDSCHYACLSTHHLLDHKPDNLLKTGFKKCRLRGFYKFGTPGIAIAWGDKDQIEDFLDVLKQAMPQKKLDLVFCRTWENIQEIPNVWESVDPPTLKQELDKLGLPEEDYYTALGLEKRGK